MYYSYDALGNLVQLQIGTVSLGYGLQPYGNSPYGGSGASTYYHYNAEQNIISKKLPNDCFTYYSYDANNRVTQILNCLPDASPLVYFEYTYDEAGRISKCRRENGTTIYYTYSPNSRLTSETWQSSDMSTIYAFSWDYDKLGNRTSSQENSSLTYYYYGEGNTLIREEPVGEDLIYYEYDNRGNCTTIKQGTSTTYFEYNPNNLVRSIHYPNGTLNYFHYDSSLRRYALEDSNGLRYFTWDRNGTDLLAERNAEGEVVVNYTHGYTPIDGIGSMVAAEKTVGTVTYYQYPIYDHRGTVMRIVDEDGEVCGDFEYSAWGKPLYEEVNGAETRFRYQSNWICLDDSAGEFVLSPTRLYHSGLGRFLQRDPAGFVDGWNLYESFGSSPLNTVDSLGLELGINQSQKQNAKKTQKTYKREAWIEKGKIVVKTRYALYFENKEADSCWTEEEKERRIKKFEKLVSEWGNPRYDRFKERGKRNKFVKVYWGKGKKIRYWWMNDKDLTDKERRRSEKITILSEPMRVIFKSEIRIITKKDVEILRESKARIEKNIKAYNDARSMERLNRMKYLEKKIKELQEDDKEVLVEYIRSSTYFNEVAGNKKGKPKGKAAYYLYQDKMILGRHNRDINVLHEIGHSFGLLDYYNVDAKDGQSGTLKCAQYTYSGDWKEYSGGKRLMTDITNRKKIIGPTYILELLKKVKWKN